MLCGTPFAAEQQSVTAMAANSVYCSPLCSFLKLFKVLVN